MLYSLMFVSLLTAFKHETLRSVSRRLSGDSYGVYNSSELSVCHDGGNLTFLVSERRCINNEELFNGK